VKALPHGFSAQTGQGPWSDSYTGAPWCICIWAYSNYVLQNGDENLPVQCDAIPERVLISRYALDKFQQCGSMASSCSQYNEAITKMCNHCAATAPDEDGKASLKKKCDEILAAASGVERLFSMMDEVTIVSLGRSHQMMGALVAGAAATGVALMCILVLAKHHSISARDAHLPDHLMDDELGMTQVRNSLELTSRQNAYPC